MSRVRITNGDLLSGAGVEGGRRKKHQETPPARQEPAEKQPDAVEKPTEQSARKPRQGRPLFGDADDADIFYSRK